MTNRIVAFLIVSVVGSPHVFAPHDSARGTSKEQTRMEKKEHREQSGGAIVLQDFYYARPDKAEEVLRHRQHASDVLQKLGLPRGRVMRRARGADKEPDVMWECEFPDSAALNHFFDVVRADSEFTEVRKHMGTLIRNSELRIWEVQKTSDEGR